jgi:ketosteroid isomerase-like protein
MVEIHARRGDRSLQNFAAHLVRVSDGRITELRMVGSKPADSDASWS